MGNWNINIQGLGCHHNDNNVYDADKLAAEFVTMLRRAGQIVTYATFTSGTAERLILEDSSGEPIPTIGVSKHAKSIHQAHAKI